MKTFAIIFLIFLCLLNAQAQDTITLKNGRVIYADIIEKSNTKITYKYDSIRDNHYNYNKIDSLTFQNPRRMFPLGISGATSLMDYDRALLLGISVDYLLTPNISIELNAGEVIDMPSLAGGISNVSLGAKYWFTNKNDDHYLSPFVGLFAGTLVDSFLPYYSFFAEVPLGISYMTHSGFQAALQLNFRSDLNFMLVELKVGWRFKVKKK